LLRGFAPRHLALLARRPRGTDVRSPTDGSLELFPRPAGAVTAEPDIIPMESNIFMSTRTDRTAVAAIMETGLQVRFRSDDE